MTEPRKLTLVNRQAPGDVLMMTCAIRDLHAQCGDRYLTRLQTTASQIWQNNPYQDQFGHSYNQPLRAEQFTLGYSSSIHQTNQRYAHFATGFVQDLSEKIGQRIRLTALRPDLHMADEEMDPARREIKDPYWIIIAGGKDDFTAKIWDYGYWCELVKMLAPDFKILQLGSKNHFHKPVPGADSHLLGQTHFRDLMRLMYHAEGVICPVTCTMHLAAAFNKPCVVIAGGREGWWWECYCRETWEANCTAPVPKDFVDHAFLHTYGKLDCCRKAGCWRSGVGEKKRKHQNCRQLAMGPTQVQPHCLTLVTPAMVRDAVRAYTNGQTRWPQTIPGHLQPPLFTEALVPTRAQPGQSIVHNSRPSYQGTPRRRYGGKRRTRRASQLVRNAQAARRAVRCAKTAGTVSKAPVGRRKAASVPEAAVQLPVAGVRTAALPTMGRTTIAALLYGDYPDLAQRCLESIYRTVDPSVFELRLGLNAVSDRIRAIAHYLADTHENVRIYDSAENIFKYPMMRRMFYEPRLATPWVIWFDDDSHVVRRDWLAQLDARIARAPADMYGKLYFYHLKEGQIPWIRAATWYRGKDQKRRRGLPKADFVTGGWWALRTEALYAMDWPDTRLQNNGGDVLCGEACWQNGFVIQQYYQGIKISDHPRRGASQKHPGA